MPLRSRLLAGFAALALGLGGVLVVAAPASAAPLTVSNLLDSGVGSLRQAISDASLAGPDTITFQAGLTGTITLASTLPAIADDLTIIGPGESVLTVDAPGTVFTLTGVPATNITVAISGLTLTSTAAGACGIDATDADLTVSNVTASDFACSGISVARGALTATDVTVERDATGIAFAGIDASDTLSLTRVNANNSSFKGISAEVVGAVATIADSTMNSSALSGLSLKATSSSVVTLQSSVAQGNTGGGIYVDQVDNSSLTIKDTQVTGNSSTFGGGIYVGQVSGGATMTIVTSTITGNTSSDDGGGIDVESLTDNGSSLIVSDSTVSGNTSGDFGGGIYLRRIGGTFIGGTWTSIATTAKATIVRTTIDGNRSGGYGAGVAINDPAPETSGLPAVLIDSSTLSNNVTPYGGGGLHIRKSSGSAIAVIRVANTTIVGNDAQAAGGLDISGPSPAPVRPGRPTPPFVPLLTVAVSQTTIAGNSAHTSGGIAASPQSLQLDNSIVAGSTSNNGNTPNDLDVNGAFVATYSLIQSPKTGTTIPGAAGNITGVDPILGPLTNNGGPTKTHLVAPGSPAYNSGDPAFTGAGLFDQRGQARVYQIVDMGAVEWQPALAHTGSAPPAPETPLIGLLLLFSGLAMVAFSRLQVTR